MKKSSIIKKFMSALLIGILLIQTVGCATEKTEVASQETNKVESEEIQTMEAEEANALSFDAIGGDDVMPIVGFYGPTPPSYSYNGNNAPDYFSDEIFELIAGTGINMIGYSNTEYTTAPGYVYKLLEQGEKYGIGIVVKDNRVSEADDLTTMEAMDSYVNDYSNYPAYVGNHIVDEPCTVEYNGEDFGRPVSKYGPVYDRVNELGIFGYSNLHIMLDKEKYIDYVDEWMKTTNPPMLSFDNYFYDGNLGLDKAPRFLSQLSVIRSAAEEAGIPFWAYVQAGSQWNDNLTYFDSDGYYPSRGEMKWNVGALLAYGAKGISYFPLIQPYYFAYAQTEPFDFQRNGLIGAWGNKTRWYYFAQEINKQVAAVDHVLMHSVNKGLIASGEEAKEDLYEDPYLMKGTSWRELKDVSGDAMIGCFNYQGKTALYVLNYDIKYAQKITLDFQDTYDITVIQNAEEKNWSCDSLELTFAAGDSALIVFE